MEVKLKLLITVDMMLLEEADRVLKVLKNFILINYPAKKN